MIVHTEVCFVSHIVLFSTQTYAMGIPRFAPRDVILQVTPRASLPHLEDVRGDLHPAHELDVVVIAERCFGT